MNDKLTIRDFLVYLITGVSQILFLLPIGIDYKKWSILEKIPTIENEVILSILFSVFVYILGHFVHIIDLFRYELGKLFSPQVISKYKFIRFIFMIIAGDRVSGILKLQNREYHGEFLDKVYYINSKDKGADSNYWYLIKDLFNGLEIVLIISSVFAIVYNMYTLFVVYAILAIFFWIKARYNTKNFILSIDKMYEALNKKETNFVA